MSIVKLFNIGDIGSTLVNGGYNFTLVLVWTNITSNITSNISSNISPTISNNKWNPYLLTETIFQIMPICP